MPTYKTIRREQIIEPPLPARCGMDEEKLYELRDSIRAMGIIQPLVVVQIGPVNREPYPPTSEGSLQAAEDAKVRYEIIAGHRRFRASGLIPLPELPCMVYESQDLAQQAVMLHENVCREDLSPFEEATFLAELIQKFDCTEEHLCRIVHQKPDYVNARLKLLTYSKPLRDALAERTITLAVAAELHRCKDEAHQKYLLDIALTSGLTAKAARSMVNQFLNQPVQDGMPGQPGGPSFTHSAPEPSPLFCFCCGGDTDPQNLAAIFVHKWELETLRRTMAKIGITVGVRQNPDAVLAPASD